MVACNQRLPSQQIVRVAHKPHLEKPDPLALWVENIESVWNSLGRPTLRIFLPDKYTIEDFSTKWKEVDSKDTITVVPPALDITPNLSDLIF